MTWLGIALGCWLGGWIANVRLANGSLAQTRLARTAVPAIFGVTVLIVWEGMVRGLGVSPVILPPPSAVVLRIASSLPTLRADFVQTAVKGALSGYLIGCTAAFVTALLIDRWLFLKRGVLPVASFMAALPIVGVAPIMVMWFGFDWQSKAAVVVTMVFFPMLVNTVAGLNAAERMHTDLMATWSAGPLQTLAKLRVPTAMPFVFNGLKISSTLALIGAIVAEFFGSPVVGMGFRITASIGQLSLDMIWAEITVAALAGSAFYGLLTIVERAITFWHPSQRTG